MAQSVREPKGVAWLGVQPVSEKPGASKPGTPPAAVGRMLHPGDEYGTYVTVAADAAAGTRERRPEEHEHE